MTAAPPVTGIFFNLPSEKNAIHLPVDTGNVRMVQRREHFRFALKPREPIVVSGERGRQDLDRDLAFQLRVRRPEHLPHPAFANLRGDFVDPETRAGCEGQVAGLYGDFAPHYRPRLNSAATSFAILFASPVSNPAP